MDKEQQRERQRLQDAYARYRRGDGITTEELREILNAIEDAQAFLSMSPDFGLARQRSIQDQSNLESYLRVRQERGDP